MTGRVLHFENLENRWQGGNLYEEMTGNGPGTAFLND